MARVVVLASLTESLINFRRALLEMLVAAGHQVTAAAPAHPATEQVLREMGVLFTPVHLERNSVDPRSDLVYFQELRRCLRATQPDVVIAYTIKPVVFGGLASRACGVGQFAALITGRGQVFSERPGPSAIAVRRVVTLLLRSSLKNATCVFFQNDDDVEFFLRRQIVTAGQICRINGSGVDLDDFLPAPMPSCVSFLMLSRLIREKGVYEYAEAARLVKNRYSGAKFRLAGLQERSVTAVQLDDLERWSREGWVQYIGELSDVRPAISQASVVVLPSFYPEGVPRSLLEALSMGRPVITTDTPGCRETTLGGATGVLVPPRDASALAEAMMMFVRDENLARQMSARCRSFAEERYDSKAVGRTILEALHLL